LPGGAIQSDFDSTGGQKFWSFEHHRRPGVNGYKNQICGAKNGLKEKASPQIQSIYMIERQ
jgi:hypothetical protein